MPTRDSQLGRWISRGAGVLLLALALLSGLMASSFPTALREADRFSPGAWLTAAAVAVMLAVSLAAYGCAWLAHGRPVRRGRRIAMLVLVCWAVANTTLWAASVADHPAIVAYAAAQRAPIPDPCAPCEDGTMPWWVCLLAGCW